MESAKTPTHRTAYTVIYTPGIAVSSMSGSVGGTTASRNRGGQYFRRRAIPTNPSSTAQQSVRAILAAQSQAWSDLTAAQRASWELWASQNPVVNALGNQITLSGHMSFIRINSRLDLLDQPALTAPPIINAPLALDSIVQDGDIGIGDVDITFTATPLAAGVVLWIEAAVVNSPGITYVRNLFRFVGSSPAAQASPFDDQSLIEDKFGTLIVGQTLFVRVSTFDVATGLISVALEDSVVITTT